MLKFAPSDILIEDASRAEEKCPRSEVCGLLDRGERINYERCVLCSLNELISDLLNELLNIGVIYVYGPSGYGAAYVGSKSLANDEEKHLTNPLFEVFNSLCKIGILPKQSRRPQEPYLIRVIGGGPSKGQRSPVVLRHYLRGIYIPLGMHRLSSEQLSDVFKAIKYLQFNHPEGQVSQATAPSDIALKMFEEPAITSILKTLFLSRKATIIDYGGGHGEFLTHFLSCLVQTLESFSIPFYFEKVHLIDAESDIEALVYLNFLPILEKIIHHSQDPIEKVLKVSGGVNFMHDTSCIQESTIAILGQVLDMYMFIDSDYKEYTGISPLGIVHMLNDALLSLAAILFSTQDFHRVVELDSDIYDEVFSGSNARSKIVKIVQEQIRRQMHDVSELPNNSFEVLASPYYYAVFSDSFHDQYNPKGLYSYSYTRAHLPYEVVRVLKNIAMHSHCVIIIDRILNASMIESHMEGFDCETFPTIIYHWYPPLSMKITLIRKI